MNRAPTTQTTPVPTGHRRGAPPARYFAEPDFTAVEAERWAWKRGWTSPLRRHPIPYVYLQTAGRSIWTVNGHNHRSTKGNLVVIPAGIPYSMTAETPVEVFLLRFRQRAFATDVPGELDAWSELTRRRRCAEAGGIVQPLPAGPARRALADVWKQAAMEWKNRNPGGPTMLKSYGLAILGLLQRLQSAETATRMEPNSLSPGIQKVLAHLEENAATPQTITDLARLAGMSRSLFHRRFRESLGTTLVAYLTRLRIAEACRRLCETDDTVLAIGLACGFNTTSRFYEAFRRHTGLSPAAFRSAVSGREPQLRSSIGRT